VQDLLQFAKPRQPVVCAVPLRALLESVVSLLSRDQTLSGVSVHLDVTDMMVSVDMDQIQQAFLNLLINGAQAMEGRGRITISATTESDRCVIAIRDEGPGIPLEAREHLFAPFFTTKHRGTGLGLATARRILDSHGGTLTLECPEDGGTIARIQVPLARA